MPCLFILNKEMINMTSKLIVAVKKQRYKLLNDIFYTLDNAVKIYNHLYYYSTSSITKKNTGPSICPINISRKSISSDN
jgi:hypothetical protein